MRRLTYTLSWTLVLGRVSLQNWRDSLNGQASEEAQRLHFQQ